MAIWAATPETSVFLDSVVPPGVPGGPLLFLDRGAPYIGPWLLALWLLALGSIRHIFDKLGG